MLQYLVKFTFIVGGDVKKYSVPQYKTIWNDASISNLDLNIDWIINDILKPNDCVYIKLSPHRHEYTVGPIQLKDFEITESLPQQTNYDTNHQPNIDYIQDITQFDQALLNWLQSMDDIRCYKYHENHANDDGKTQRKRRQLITSEEANKFIQTGNSNIKYAASPLKINSHSLREINKLRNGEGLPAWQTKLGNNPKPFGVDTNAFNSKLISYAPKFGMVTMTKYDRIRRLMEGKEKDNTGIQETVTENGINSYLSSIPLSSFATIIQHLPWWLSVSVVIIAIISIISLLVYLKRLRRSTRFNHSSYKLMSPSRTPSIQIIVV